MISLTQGVILCQTMEPVLREIGYHCALTGSVLYAGKSEKDLDIIVYPHKRDETKNPVDILIHLTKIGITNSYKTDPAYQQSGMDVFKAKHSGDVLDLFFLTRTL